MCLGRSTVVSVHLGCLEMDQAVKVGVKHVTVIILLSITDIDDCSPNPCYHGVACSDMPAPRRGYSCGSCPSPMIGDGITCSRPTYITCPQTVKCYPGVKCLLLPGDKVLCGPCPDGMLGDGLLCKSECPPPCNSHQKCSTSEACSMSEAIPVSIPTTPAPPTCKRPCR